MSDKKWTMTEWRKPKDEDIIVARVKIKLNVKLPEWACFMKNPKISIKPGAKIECLKIT